MNASTLLVLILVFGILQNRDNIIQWLNPPPVILNAAVNNQVILYSTTWCGYCAKTRQYLNENHINFSEIDVEHTEKGRSDYERFGRNGVPIVVINNKTIIHGYDPVSISEVLSNTAGS